MASSAAQPALASLISENKHRVFLDDSQHEGLSEKGNLVVNHYEFLRELGRGAFAVVALARHEVTRELVVRTIMIIIGCAY